MMPAVLTALASRLGRLIKPTYRLVCRDSETLLGGGALGWRRWVVARALCQFHSLDLANVEPRDREQRLRLLTRTRCVWPDPLTTVRWVGAQAHLWWVDRAGVLARSDDPGLALALAAGRLLPESALLAPPASPTATRLLQLAEGFEGQRWQAGVLSHSRWWAHPPEQKDWSDFLRGCGLAPQPLPAAECLPYLNQPWGRARLDAAALQRLAGSSLAVRLVGALLVAALAYQGVGWLRATWGLQALQRQTDALTLAVEDEIAHRDRAERDQAFATRVAALRQQQDDPLMLLVDLRRSLPRNADLVELDWRDGQLRALVAGELLDPRAYVEPLENSGRFREVIVAPGSLRDTLSIMARYP
jgi:hypothetical protein